MKFSALLSLFVAASISSAIAHIDALQEEDDGGIYVRWGSGKYKIDDNVYHREVKPHILSVFRQKPSFTSLCGSNPDFFVEKDGTVYPGATDSKLKKAGKCTKKKYNEEMGDYLKQFVGKT